MGPGGKLSRREFFYLSAAAGGLAMAGYGGRAHAAPVYPSGTKLTPKAMPQVARPGYLRPITDPTFGTRVVRISDEVAFGNKAGSREPLRHAYAKNQTWNADGSLLMLDYIYPAPILDGRTYEFLRRVHQPSLATWSNVDPFKTIGTAAGTNRLISADMRRDWDITTLRSFRDYDTIDFGIGEGNLSNDDHYIALFGTKDGASDLFVYDFKNERIVSRRDLGDATIGTGNTTINNATMSQSGDYVVLQYNAQGRNPKQGIVVFDRDLKYLRNLSARGGAHYDVGYDTRGREAIVVQDDASSAIVSVRLDDGARTTLLTADQMNYSIHISCRNIDRPGWAYISEFTGTPVVKRANYQEVFAVKVDGSGMVNRFAHEHHSPSRGYAHAPMGVPNRDGSKVLWASDWGNRHAPVYAHVARMPTP